MNASEQYVRIYEQFEHKPFDMIMLLKHGRGFSERSTHQVPQGRMRMCYQNAFLLAMRRSDFTYVEGYAVPAGIPLPLSHAWCIDREGRIVDPTWPDGSNYFGIPFRITTVAEVALKTEGNSVMGNLWQIRGMKHEAIIKMIEDGVVHQPLLEKQHERETAGINRVRYA